MTLYLHELLNSNDVSKLEEEISVKPEHILHDSVERGYAMGKLSQLII